MSSKSIYCTYLTTYLGNKMPMFYIGSASMKRIENGYHGSISSKLYSTVYKEELLSNPHLFKTKIISTHPTDKEAKQKELFFQQKLNVVKSSMYINMSFATVNGFFGKDVSGENNPMFGKRGINNPNFGSKRSNETKHKMSKSNSRPMSERQKKKLSEINTGKTHSKESNEKNRRTHLLQYQNGSHNSQIKYKCQHCCKVGFGSAMKRYHLDNCKLNECNEHNVIGSYEPINKKLKHLTCPHCGVIGSGINNMKRYHFDNCKHRS